MHEVVALRLNTSLRTTIGPDLTEILSQDDVTDLMLNPSGDVWVARLGKGRVSTGYRMDEEKARAALFLIADYCGVPLTSLSPLLSAKLPHTGERIAGAIPPVTSAPCFAIRKPSRGVIPLSGFHGPIEESSIFKSCCYGEPGDNDLPPSIAHVAKAVDARKFVLVAGATGSGKTAFMNALLARQSVTKDRIISIEDVDELQLDAPDHVKFITTPEVDQHKLLQLSLRFRPDRIIVGEVRGGPAAMEMIDSANTGHTGGLCSTHANSCKDALRRIERLCSRVSTQTPVEDVHDAIDVVVYVERTGIIQDVIELRAAD